MSNLSLIIFYRRRISSSRSPSYKSRIYYGRLPQSSSITTFNTSIIPPACSLDNLNSFLVMQREYTLENSWIQTPPGFLPDYWLPIVLCVCSTFQNFVLGNTYSSFYDQPSRIAAVNTNRIHLIVACMRFCLPVFPTSMRPQFWIINAIMQLDCTWFFFSCKWYSVVKLGSRSRPPV